MNKDKLKQEFEEKFCDEDCGRETKEWEGYWQEVSVYAADVWSFISSAVDRAYDEGVNDMFYKLAELAEPDERQPSAGELVTNLDEVHKIRKQLLAPTGGERKT